MSIGSGNVMCVVFRSLLCLGGISFVLFSRLCNSCTMLVVGILFSVIMIFS